jgi:hypothetical protein
MQKSTSATILREYTESRVKCFNFGRVESVHSGVNIDNQILILHYGIRNRMDS